MSPRTLFVDYELDCILIAIKAKIEDYQFAYFLNKAPFFLFERSVKDISFIQNQKTLLFPCFQYCDDEMRRSSFLIKNKVLYNGGLPNTADNLFFQENLVNTIYLIAELKEFDYLLRLDGVWRETEVFSLKKYLKIIPFVDDEISIQPQNLKSINNLVF